MDSQLERFWTVAISPKEPCYDGAAAVTEEALGAGGGLRTVSDLLSHQYTQTGTNIPSVLLGAPCIAYVAIRFLQCLIFTQNRRPSTDKAAESHGQIL